MRALQLAPYSTIPELLIDDIISGEISESLIDERENQMAKHVEFLMKEEEDRNEAAQRARVEKERLEVKEMLRKKKKRNAKGSIY